MPAEDIDWALSEFRDNARQTRYDLGRSYYLGDHRMAFATDKFRSVFGALFHAFADNLCPAVIDSLVDRLEVTGFSSAGGERQEAGRVEIEAGDELAARAWNLWRRNAMEQRSPEVHREALTAGDGYVIVWPNEQGEAVVWPQVAHEMAVSYDANAPGAIRQAAKLWRAPDGYLRLNLFYADRVEKYRSAKATRSFSVPAAWRAKHFALLPPERSLVSPGADFDVDAIIPNPYDRVPVFHFPNKRLHAPGLSELLDVIPIQDALNKANMDLIVTMEFSAYRQRWATGIEVEVDDSGRPKTVPFEAGIDRFITGSSADVRFGEFAATDLNQFLAVSNAYREELARVSGTPLHYFHLSKSDYPSGEAMKSAEARFSKKIRDRQVSFGNVWEDVVGFALRIEGEELPAGVRLNSLWEGAAPRSEKEIAETLQMKRVLGVSKRQLFKELGYDEELIEQMLAEGAALTEERDEAIVPTATGRERLPPG